MKSYLNLALVLAITVLLQSCITSYKPSALNYETKEYRDYKNNYHIKIQEDYNLVTPENTEKMRQVLFPNAPKDLVIFINKKKQATVAMYSRPFNAPIRPVTTKEEMPVFLYLIALQSGATKTMEACNQCRNVEVTSHSDHITIEFDLHTEFADEKVIMKQFLYPLSKDSNQLGMFELFGASKEADYDSFKEDFFAMSNSFRGTVFQDYERELK